MSRDLTVACACFPGEGGLQFSRRGAAEQWLEAEARLFPAVTGSEVPSQWVALRALGVSWSRPAAAVEHRS